MNSACMYDGMLFVGGKNSGLSVIGKSGVLDSIPLSKAATASGKSLGGKDLIEMLSNFRIRSIVRDSKNRLWISTFGENGLLRYENGSVVRFSTEDGLPSDRVRTVIELKDGRYAAACTGGDNSEPITMRIIKEKSMYELTWFRIACAGMVLLFLMLIVMAYNRAKTRKFIKKEKEQKQLIREIVEAFAKVIDMKDNYTNGHSSRVAEYTVMLARELGYDEEEVDKFYNIALMHDIGKVGVPPEVLNKPGKLTDEEFKTIKSHAALGYDTLKGISIMPELAIGAGFHHERPDGRGYPKGLKGDEIPRVAQIIAVADTFEAMYSNRPYRKRMNFEKAVSIIKEVRGTQLQSDVVDAFLRLVDKGKLRAPDDFGGGTTEDINNIHKKQNEEEKKNAGK